MDRKQIAQKSTTARSLGLLTVFLWATGFVYTSVALKDFTPFSLGFLRYGIASLILLAIAIIGKIGFPAKRDIPLFFLLGFLGFSFYTLTFNYAMTMISAATSSIIAATVPIMTATVSALLFKERLRKIQWVAVALEFCGIILLNLDGGQFTLNVGLIWMFIAAVSFAAYNIVLRRTTSHYSPLQTTIYTIICGQILLLFLTGWSIREFIAAPIAAKLLVLYIGVIPSSIAFLTWSKATKIANRLSDVTNFMFVTPLLATGMDFIVTKTVPSSGTLIGGGVILTGLALFLKSQRTTE